MTYFDGKRFLRTNREFIFNQSVCSLADQKQNNVLKLNPSPSPISPLLLVTVGAAGMSLASQRPQKHAVGSVNHVRGRMSQCYPPTRKDVFSQNKIINTHANYGTLAVYIKYIKVNQGERKERHALAHFMCLPIIN